jgi:hypothetical protein
MTACRTPQSSAHLPSKTPSRVGSKLSSFVLPAIASFFPAARHPPAVDDVARGQVERHDPTDGDDQAVDRDLPVRVDVLPVELVALHLDDELVGRSPLVARTAGLRASTTAAILTSITAGSPSR